MSEADAPIRIVGDGVTAEDALSGEAFMGMKSTIGIEIGQLAVKNIGKYGIEFLESDNIGVSGYDPPSLDQWARNASSTPASSSGRPRRWPRCHAATA